MELESVELVDFSSNLGGSILSAMVSGGGRLRNSSELDLSFFFSLVIMLSLRFFALVSCEIIIFPFSLFFEMIIFPFSFFDID
eukprot:UN06896